MVVSKEQQDIAITTAKRMKESDSNKDISEDKEYGEFEMVRVSSPSEMTDQISGLPRKDIEEYLAQIDHLQWKLKYEAKLAKENHEKMENKLSDEVANCKELRVTIAEKEKEVGELRERVQTDQVKREELESDNQKLR